MANKKDTKILTPEQINKLLEVYDKQAESNQKADRAITDKIKNSKERKIKRADNQGKMVEIREYDAWEEVRHLGWDCEAGKALREKYPEIFNLIKEHEQNRKEYYDYCMGELRIDPYHLSLRDIVLIAQAVVKGNEK